MTTENPLIYVVTSGDYSEYHIDAVFTDKDLATRYVELNPQCYIDEWMANKLDDPHPGLQRFRVWMDSEGNTSKYGTGPISHDGGDCGGEKFVFGGEFYPDEVIAEVRTRDGWQRIKRRRQKDWFQFLIWTKDLTHAIKIANDRRAQMIANNEWTPSKDKGYTFPTYDIDQSILRERLLKDVSELTASKTYEPPKEKE